MRQSTDRRTPRPVGPAAAALSKMLSRAWSLPPQRNFVAIERNVQVPMSDGTVLLADHYLPITSQPAATVLVRCPYGRGAPFSLLQAQLVAERGFHVLLQSCRGTFGSGGQFEPMRREASDGQDTVAWLRGQSWFDGRLATFGASYLGFVQWALALDPPPELVAAVVVVGPHDFSRTAYRNGAFDLYNFLSWSDLIVHQERVNPVSGIVRIGHRGPAAAPGARPGAGHRGRSRPARHRGTLVRDLAGASAADRSVLGAVAVRGRAGAHLGPHAADRRLAGPLPGADPRAVRGAGRAGRAHPHARRPVDSSGHRDEGRARVRRRPRLARTPRRPGPRRAGHRSLGAHWVGGAREWREMATWPPAGQTPQRWYLGPDGTLSPKEPPDGTPASFRYDPADPTPSVGGAILALNAGVRDNRAVEQRPDVLVFTSEPLDEPVEVIGDVTAELHVTRDNPNADLFVRLCDVDPRGAGHATSATASSASPTPTRCPGPSGSR